MNLKRKTIGALAAGALSLGLVSGAVAQEVEDVTTSATLDQAATCVVVIDGASSGDFGEFTWSDEAGFTPATGTASISGTLDAEDDFDPVACQLAMTGTSLTVGDPDTPDSEIPAGNITVAVTEPGAPAQEFPLDEGATLTGVGTGNPFTVTMTLDVSALDQENVSLGTHTGTVTFTAAPADPE